MQSLNCIYLITTKHLFITLFHVLNTIQKIHYKIYIFPISLFLSEMNYSFAPLKGSCYQNITLLLLGNRVKKKEQSLNRFLIVCL
jgi:hypothetical protein